MDRLKRFRRLARAERALLLQAALAIVAVRFALRFLSFERVRALACRAAGSATCPLSSQCIVWAIEAASRQLPSSSCLTKALAAQALLNRHGYASQLMIGVARNEAWGFEAHAWITCQNQVLIGGPETERYAPLLNLGVRS